MLWGLLLNYTSVSMLLYWVKPQYWHVYPRHHLLQVKLLLGVGQHNQVLWLAWLEVSRRIEQNVIRGNVQRKMDWYHQLFLLGEGEKIQGPPTPTTVSPPFIYFFASFAILFTTQEYTHQSPGGASWMRAEIQCAHYAVKSIVSHHSFSWVAFVLFKCLHGTAWGLEDRCMVQEYCLSTIPLSPGWK